MKTANSRPILFAVIATLLVGVGCAFAIWYKIFREVRQPAWIAADKRSEFLYGSLGAERRAGMPYWIWLVLPRIFPEYLPGPGGYAALGFPWEETREMPAGFSKKTVGYVRVAGNCAICHASSRPNGPDEAPTVLAVGPGHTAEVDRLQKFYRQCAADPRFTPNDILDEVDMATKLSFLDKLLYRFVLIPRTRKQLLQSRDVMLDSELWEHSHNPHANPEFLKRMHDLEPVLSGQEKDIVSTYLRSAH